MLDRAISKYEICEICKEPAMTCAVKEIEGIKFQGHVDCLKKLSDCLCIDQEECVECE